MKYNIVLPKSGTIDNLLSAKRFAAFGPLVTDFIKDFSNFILLNRRYKEFPEIMALAFWLREGHIKKLKISYENSRVGKIMLPRGIVFHIAPANVDTIFIYSWFLSMLVGNANIIRVSSRSNAQLDLLLEIFKHIMAEDKYQKLSHQFLIVKYEHDDEITEYFSSMCNVRVVWGGDETIKKIRSISLPPYATEICFANKFSLGIIKSSAFLDLDNKVQLLEKFYNDVYVFSQLACSSPRLIVWVGDSEENKKAASIFWTILSEVVARKKLSIEDAAVMEKFVTECSLSINHAIQVIQTEDNIINRVKFLNIHDVEMKNHCGNGLFYEVEIEKLSDIVDTIQVHNQTLTSYGFTSTELKSDLLMLGVKGIDRIVNFGQALDFAPIWDGYDLLREFEREVELNIAYEEQQ